MSNTEQVGPAENPAPNGPIKGFLPGKMYDKLKWVALVFLPAFATLYFSLGGVWDFPRVDDVMKTIVSLETFLGILLGLSSKAYNASDSRFAGEVVVFNKTNDDGEPAKLYSIELGPNIEPWDLDQNKELTFKVRSVADPQS